MTTDLLDYKSAIHEYLARWIQRFAGQALVELVGECETPEELGENLRLLVIRKAAELYEASPVMGDDSPFWIDDEDGEGAFNIEMLAGLMCGHSGAKALEMLLPVVAVGLLQVDWTQIADLASDVPDDWEDEPANKPKPSKRNFSKVVGVSDSGERIEFASIKAAAAAGYSRNGIYGSASKGCKCGGYRWELLPASEAVTSE
jgi:hypothetical protein